MKTKFDIGDRVYCLIPSVEFDNKLEIGSIEIIEIKISFEGILYKDYKGNNFQEHQLGKPLDELKKNMLKNLIDYTQKEKKKIMSVFWREEV